MSPGRIEELSNGNNVIAGTTDGIMDREERKKAICIMAIVAVVSGLLGFLCTLGYAHSSLAMISRLTHDSYQYDDHITQEILERIDSHSLGEHLRLLTLQPHMTGQRRDEEIANFIRTSFAELDIVTTHRYDVLLSFPNGPNKVDLLDGSSNIIFTTNSAEPGAADDGSYVSGTTGNVGMTSGGTYTGGEVVLEDGLIQAYSAYSPSAIINDGTIVYVNFGRKQDFEKLKELGVSLLDRIVIARYGMIHAREKVKLAALNGARGLILYSDPEDVARNGESTHQVYPNTWWLPGTGVQRDSILPKDGDPLTPGWPSVGNVHRIDQVHLTASLPTIPVLPLGYRDAKAILGRLGGKDVPPGWIGKLEGITYKFGGEFAAASNTARARLTVSNELKRVHVSNVIGIIRGSVEPDRYVIVGNHRDAWGYGAVDASSGTAAMVKVAEAMVETMRAYSWRPRRTIVFASFAASEFGRVGSREWVEEHLPKLQDRTVAYINADMCVSGPDLDATASLPLKNLVKQAVRNVPDPFNLAEYDRTYYDYWRDKVSANSYLQPSDVYVGDVDGRGDQAAFVFLAGIPSLNLRFINGQHNLSTFYPAFHTGYDTFRMYQQIIDPGFKMLQTCGRVLAHSLRQVADSAILPYDIEAYGIAMRQAMSHLRDYVNRPITSTVSTGGLGVATLDLLSRQQNVTFEHLEGAINEFSMQARNWTLHLNDTDFSDPLAVRMVNDQIMQLEKLFLMPAGLPLQNDTRHSLLKATQYDKYGQATFPGIINLLDAAIEMHLNALAPIEERMQWKGWEMLRLHVSHLYVMIRQAASFLRPLHVI